MKQIACINPKCKRVRWTRTVSITQYELNYIPSEDRPALARQRFCMGCRPKPVKLDKRGWISTNKLKPVRHKKGKGKGKKGKRD